MNLTEITFLAALLAGIFCLVAGLFVARLHWREDAAPFGRRSNMWDVGLNPGKYADAGAVPLIRRLHLLGAVLLAVAVLAVIWEACSDLRGDRG